MSYSSQAYDCCFNGNVLMTCQYCDQPVLLAEAPEYLTVLAPITPVLQATIPIICRLYRLIEIGKRGALLEGARTPIVAELSDNWAPDVLRVGNRGRVLSLLGFGVDFFLMTLVSNELAIHPLTRPQRGE
ncbi:hypothetical protein EAF00_006441 [Botryotinia globosa]|nr:hypothetical protein EAF00_006441 [Botryotinia globosa]